MTIREKIRQLPAWKAGIILLLGIFLLTAALDEILFSRVFSIMDHMITRFETLFKNDTRDIDKDYEAFNRNQEIFNQKWQQAAKEEEARLKKSEQDDYCNDYLQIKGIKEAILSDKKEQTKEHPSPFHFYVSDDRRKTLKQDEKMVAYAIENHLFDPSQCEASQS